jgi:hypothetical protein
MTLPSLLKPQLLLLCLASCVMLGSSGCLTSGKRVVFIPTSDALVRLGPDVTGHVYHWTGDEWELSKNRVTLPEGWLAGPLDLPERDAE